MANEPIGEFSLVLSDFSTRVIDDQTQAVRITVTFGDPRRPAVYADAHVGDDVVHEILDVAHRVTDTS